MFPSNCKAVLRAIDDTVVEYGQANISLKDRYVEFTSPFVPILKIDTTAKIVCLEGDSQTHVITGTVYLSAKNLLRLINIKCKLIPHAEDVLEIPTFLNAQIFKPVIKNGLFAKNKIDHRWDDCTIISISLRSVSIRASRIMCDQEDCLKLRIGEPVFLKDTELDLSLAHNGLMFGKNSKYTYNITNINEKEKAELADFIRLGSLELIKGIQ